ncbi:MAG: outer membrane beta-barrel protein [Polaribacter sp.]|nr:outer membrane beta-barrel protein [Polaribacter sp.]
MKQSPNLFLLALIICISSFTTSAQELYVATGKTQSSFDYTNSKGQTLDNLQASTHNFLEVGYKDQIFIKNLYSSLGIGYASYGAIGSDNSAGNFMEWNVNYAELKAGLEYTLFTIQDFSFYAKGAASLGFLIQGTQTHNNAVINLKNEDDFDKTLINYRAGAGFVRPISETLSVSLEYMYGKSRTLKEGTVNTADQEVLKIVSHNLSVGLLINISN